MSWMSLHGLSLRLSLAYSPLFLLPNSLLAIPTPHYTLPTKSILTSSLYSLTLSPQLQLQFHIPKKTTKNASYTCVLSDCYDRMKKAENGARWISVFFLLVHTLSLSLSHSTGGRCKPIPAHAATWLAPLSTRTVAVRLYSLCASTTPHGWSILIPLFSCISLTLAVYSAQAAVGLLSLSHTR